MSFFGLGGFEILLIGAIALFVLGPKRMLEAIREGRKIYRDLRRQKDALQKMVSEAIDLEDIKKQIDADGLKESVKNLENDLGLDRAKEEIQKATDAAGSISRDAQFSSPPKSESSQGLKPTTEKVSDSDEVRS
jgi:Tat protein translocase TatB subunit